ncbi:MAG: TlpA family protein disulfide reductase [Acidobacteria bacterium]|nr:TlpA family protein disulfide reductase [Acidobacteriota bacterium]
MLLNFWYPFCGPCRGENPSLQKVLKRVGMDKFAILAVNVYPAEDKFVMPYMKGNAFDFVPLHGNEEFAEKEWGARGYPTNFLIDPQGRTIYRLGPMRGEAEERRFELQIRLLLDRNEREQSRKSD